MKRLLTAALLALTFARPAQAQTSLTTTVCPGAGCVTANVSGQGSIGIQITGTWSGTITFQSSVDNSTFTTLLVTPSNSATQVSTTTGNGVWSVGTGGLSAVRVAFTSFSSGPAVVTLKVTQVALRGSGGGGGIPGGGTVTSVDVTSITGLATSSGGPVTSSGSITLDLDVQDANKVFAGPTTGADAAPTFRTLVAADIPYSAFCAGATTTQVLFNNAGTCDGFGTFASNILTIPAQSILGTVAVPVTGGYSAALVIGDDGTADASITFVNNTAGGALSTSFYINEAGNFNIAPAADCCGNLMYNAPDNTFNVIYSGFTVDPTGFTALGTGESLRVKGQSGYPNSGITSLGPGSVLGDPYFGITALNTDYSNDSIDGLHFGQYPDGYGTIFLGDYLGEIGFGPTGQIQVYTFDDSFWRVSGAGSDLELTSGSGNVTVNANSGYITLSGPTLVYASPRNLGDWEIFTVTGPSVTGAPATSYASLEASIYATGNTSTRLYGVLGAAQGTDGDFDAIYGLIGGALISGDATAGHISGVYAIPKALDTSVVTHLYGVYYNPTVDAGATVTGSFGLWSEDLTGKGTNPYFIWYDGGPGSDCNGNGVTRINVVGVFAHYNQCFVKYTEGATNFERILIEWGDTGRRGTDNIAYIGVEAGGTGTNRNLNILGAEVGVMTIPGTYGVIRAGGYKSSDGTAGATGTCAGFPVVKNGLVVSCTGI